YAAFLYSSTLRNSVREDFNVEMLASRFPDCRLRNRRLCRRTREKSSTQTRSTTKRHNAAADFCQSGELPCGLGGRNWRYVCGDDRWRRALEIRGRARSRELAIP